VHLADNVMPVVAAIACSDSESKPGASSFFLDAAEQRLMSQFSSRPADHKSYHRRKTSWQIPVGHPDSPRFGRGGPHRFAAFCSIQATPSEEKTTRWPEPAEALAGVLHCPSSIGNRGHSIRCMSFISQQIFLANRTSPLFPSFSQE
jgi:hypothetical protein